jgi:hypothetical protein
MSKLYRIIVDIELPVGHVPAAKVLVAADPIIEAMKTAMTDAGLKFQIKTDTVSPRGPKASAVTPPTAAILAPPVVTEAVQDATPAPPVLGKHLLVQWRGIRASTP